MSLWASFTGRVRSVFRATTLANPAKWFIDWLNDGYEADTGVVVNGKTILQYAPVWHSVNKITGHVGMLPIHLHEQKDERTAVPATRHPAYRLMKTRPNSMMTAIVFKEIIQGHVLLRGNGRAAILRNQRNDPTELIPLLPDRTITVLVNGEKWHIVTNPETGERDKLPDRDVLHVPGFGYDGIQGYDVVEFAKNSIGLGMAAEKQTSKHYKNNAVPSLVLEAPTGVFKKKEEAEEFLNNWNKYHQGLSESNKVGLLREGIKAHELSTNAKDSDTVAQRLFQRQEAALWFSIEQILGDDSSVSYNSLEEKNKAYLTNCLMKWLTKWEQECDEKLLTGLQKRQSSHFFKFQTAALLRGTTKERYEVYQIGRQIEVLSANDVRALEDLPPIEGGDTYKNPAINPQGPAGGKSATPPEPPPDPDKTPPEPTGDDKAAALVRSRVREIVKVESQRAIDAAAKPERFTAWLDSFYSDSGFFPRLNAVVLECGGSLANTLAYANESKQILLDMSGRHGADAFAAAVQFETSKWGERADRLAAILTQQPERKAA